MNPHLVPIEKVLSSLRLGSSQDDIDLMLPFFEAANELVLAYVDAEKVPFVDSDGQYIVDSHGDFLEVPARIQQAVIVTAGALYGDPAGMSGKAFAAVDLPESAIFLLRKFALPGFA